MRKIYLQKNVISGYLVAFCLFLSGCGSRQLFGPTVTSTPTYTNTPTLTATHTPEPSLTFTITITPTPVHSSTPLPLTPEEQAVKDFEDLGVSPDLYIISLGKDDVVQAIKTGTKIVIYKDGKFSYDFIFWVAKQTCDRTNWKPLPGKLYTTGMDAYYLGEYIINMTQSYFDQRKGNLLEYPIKGTEYCWVVADKANFFFTDFNKVVHQVPVFDLDKRSGSQGLW
jgi:hypothetical protein